MSGGGRLVEDLDGNKVPIVTLCRRVPEWAASRIDTLERSSAAWEALYKETHRQARRAGDALDLVRGLLSQNGCDCACDCCAEEHEDECERCLACQIAAVLP